MPAATPPVHRETVLRQVVQVLDRRLDGVLPRDVPGRAECFADDIDLVGTLALRWHARLMVRLDAALDRPLDAAGGHLGGSPGQQEARAGAVAQAWATTAEELRGVRRLLDRLAEHPTSPEVAELLDRCTTTEHGLLANAAGAPVVVAAGHDERHRAVGRRLLARGRAQVRPAFADRLRALVPA